MEKALDSRLANIKALEKTLARRKEEIRQIEGQIASDKDNLRGSTEVWLLRKLDLETKYELVETAYNHAVRTCCSEGPVDGVEHSCQIVCDMANLLEAMNKLLDDKFYGASTKIGKAAFAILNEDIKQYVGVYFTEEDAKTYEAFRSTIKSTLDRFLA